MLFNYDRGAIFLGDNEVPILHVFMNDPFHLIYHTGEERHKLPLVLDAAEAQMVQRPFKVSSNTRYEIEMIYHGDIQTYIKDSIQIDVPFCAPVFRIRNRRKDTPDVFFTPIVSICDLNTHKIYDEVGIMYNDQDKQLMDPYRISIMYFTEGYENFFDGLYDRCMLFFKD